MLVLLEEEFCDLLVVVMGSYKKSQAKDAACRRFVSVIMVTLSGVLLLMFLLRTRVVSKAAMEPAFDAGGINLNSSDYSAKIRGSLNLPARNKLSVELERRNQLTPRNRDLFPTLAADRVIIVLYVHNRPQYLRVVVESLSRVVGIGETLLIVSHDGYFSEMNEIIEGIRFCQVKPIFAPYSPHIFRDSFPGVSPNDCRNKEDAAKNHCDGNTDQYGNHRSPKIVSLKHHWWWMMNTVWDGLQETRGHSGHILFIEEDHFIFPNAYRNLQALVKLKPKKCPSCYAANLAPSDVNSRGEGWASLIAERMGNVGYSFNRTVWRKIHRKAQEFCYFDEYNWDITMWATVYPSFGAPVYTLRGPRASAVHFGKCGLHQGQGENKACIDNGAGKVALEEVDKVLNIDSKWDVRIYEHQPGYMAGFKGWGGWGDERDRRLCAEFSRMYQSAEVASF